jgi:ankyrin repeat protein
LAFDAANAAGETPLMMACLKGSREAASTLLALGAQVKRSGWTPLHYAASGGHVDLMQRLLAEGALIDARAPGGQTPLIMASGFGSIDAADWLLGRGANAGLRNEAGRSAADFARSAGWDGLAERLDQAAGQPPRATP